MVNASVSGVLAGAVQPQSDPLWLGLMSASLFPAIIHLFQKGRNQPTVEDIADRFGIAAEQTQSNSRAAAHSPNDSSHLGRDRRNQVDPRRSRGLGAA